MTSVDKVENDDDSFIILGTSPGSSLDMKCPLASATLEDALKDLSDEATMAFKAHFQLGDCPSPASMMVASTIVTDETSTENLQKRFGELLDENVILKETLKQNNDSMKEQFLLIASCQEDMLRTQELHKEKFEETKELVEKLRLENKKLKQEMMRKSETEVQTGTDSADGSGPPSALEFVTSPDDDTVNKLTAQLELIEKQRRQEMYKSDAEVQTGSTDGSGRSSAMEFVTSPDDDTIYKLAAQLELIEKQRRQVLVENDKLTWQKESLEHIVDATSKERDELKDKLHKVELKLSSKDSEYSTQINSLKSTVQDLHGKLQSANSITSVSSEEIYKRESTIQQLEGKVAALQIELKNAQLRILELENVKLEFTKHRSGLSETVRIYKEQIQELHTRLKDAQTTVFQPVRLSLSGERESPRRDSECGGLMNDVKLYDRTLKHLADLMNALTNGLSDNLVQTLGLVASLQDFKLERATVEQFKSSLGDVKLQLEKQHSNSLNYVVQVRGTLTIFENIFKDYNELLKKTLTKQEPKPATPNVDALTSALLARGQELQNLEAEVKRLREANEDMELLKAQMDLYRSDFEAEREAREKMACEKENIATDLRTAQKRIQELLIQLDEIRKLDSNLFFTATAAGSSPRGAASSFPRGTHGTSAATNGTARTASSSTGAAKKQVYTCPKCMKFKSDTYRAMEDHLDFCLDLNDPCSPI